MSEEILCPEQDCEKTYTRSGLWKHVAREHDKQSLMLTVLRDFAEEIGETPTARDLEDCVQCPTRKAYDRVFGSWNSALEEAGLSENKSYSLGEEHLITQLQLISEEIGRTPTFDEMERHEDYPSPHTYFNYFESWNSALDEAGLDVGGHVHRSREELLNILQNLSDELGRPPRISDLNRSTSHPSQQPYLTEFGTWTDALIEAGLVEQSECNGWSKHRYGPRWLEKRADAIERDGSTCRVCRSEPDKLDVHHITPRKEYYSSDDLDWEDVNEAENLITLCSSCHKSLEGTFQESEPDEFAQQAREYLKKSRSIVE